MYLIRIFAWLAVKIQVFMFTGASFLHWQFWPFMTHSTWPNQPQNGPHTASFQQSNEIFSLWLLTTNVFHVYTNPVHLEHEDNPCWGGDSGLIYRSLPDFVLQPCDSLEMQLVRWVCLVKLAGREGLFFMNHSLQYIIITPCNIVFLISCNVVL